MLQKTSTVYCIDNSLVVSAKIHHIYNKTGIAAVGDIVRVAIKKRKPGCTHSVGSVCKALIVRTVAPVIREDGARVSSSQNDCILLSANLTMLHTRLLFPLFKEYNRIHKLESIKTKANNFKLI